MYRITLKTLVYQRAVLWSFTAVLVLHPTLRVALVNQLQTVESEKVGARFAPLPLPGRTCAKLGRGSSTATHFVTRRM